MSTHDRAANQAIDEVYRRFSDAYRQLAADSVGALYTDDALYLPPEGDIVRSRLAITERFKGFFEAVRQQGRSVRITFTSVDRLFTRDLAVDVGYYELVTDSAGRRVGTLRGKFVTFWRRDPFDTWRIHVDSHSGVSRPDAPELGVQADTAVGQ